MTCSDVSARNAVPIASSLRLVLPGQPDRTGRTDGEDEDQQAEADDDQSP